jgi:glycine oxidase
MAGPNHVAVVGGGVCGLGVGWKLAKAGVRTTVFDRGRATRESTWAAAGMLAAHMELRPEEEHITFLGRKAMERWRAFAGELEAESGIPIDYRDEGTLYVALDRDAVEELRFLRRHQEETGVPVEWLSGDEAREREPFLSRRVAAALFADGDHRIDPRAFAEALTRAFVAAGGDLREETEVERIEIEGGKVRGVRVAGEFLEADIVVLAAGAWSGLVDGLPKEAVPPVRPVKGQMFSVRMADPPLLTRCVWAKDSTRFAYLVPLSSGRLLVGATVEEMGYDREVTAGGIYELLRPAYDALPGIYELPVDEIWAGLRPASRDNAPILGETPVEGLVMATGHYRNGILFAPLTSEDVAHLVLTGETTEAIAPYGIGRFGLGKANS